MPATLQTCIDKHMDEVRLFCTNHHVCWHSETFDARTLADRLGADMPLDAIRARAVCKACGHRGATLHACPAFHHA